MKVNPVCLLGIPFKVVASQVHAGLKALVAIRTQAEHARHRVALAAIAALTAPGGPEHWGQKLAQEQPKPPTPAPMPGRQDLNIDSRNDLAGGDLSLDFAASDTDSQPITSDACKVDGYSKGGQTQHNEHPQAAARVADATAMGTTQTCELAAPKTTSSLTVQETTASGYHLVAREAVRESGVYTGVSLGWLARRAADLSLCRDELEELLATRRDFGAGMPALMKAVANGIPVSDVYHLYRVREEAASVFDGPTFSIKWIHAFCETFPEAQVDHEGLADFLIDVYGEVKARLPWIRKYPDDSLQTLIQIARSYGVNNVDSCLDRIGPPRHHRERVDEDDDRDDWS